MKKFDTDSLFIKVGQWFKDNDANLWDTLGKEEKIEYCRKISKITEEYVNDRIFNEVQKIDYNSQMDDFRINFEQEIILQAALFVAKKKYGYWCVDEGGVPLDKLKVTGLEIVRSDSPEMIREALKEILSMILKNETDSSISKKIQNYKSSLLKCLPEEIAANVGVNGITKYVNSDLSCKKGSPWHVKAAANYKKMLLNLKLNNKKYEDIFDGSKIKVVYLKKNKYNMETMAFLRWPQEFNGILDVDMKTMIDKFFIKKIETLLKPMKKEGICNSNEHTMGVFF